MSINVIAKKLYEKSSIIIKEFVEDGIENGFDDISMVVWYNTLSSLCALAYRLPEIKGNEKLAEKVVYDTMMLILENDVPMSEDQKRMALKTYKSVGPTIIDIMIPGSIPKCCCFPGTKRKYEK
uniref:Uncharacterized protein n=1 Tax=viral metagenome TaxID=1070528 RepID=A0A6C0LUV9_9ZZZZ